MAFCHKQLAPQTGQYVCTSGRDAEDTNLSSLTLQGAPPLQMRPEGCCWSPGASKCCQGIPPLLQSLTTLCVTSHHPRVCFDPGQVPYTVFSLDSSFCCWSVEERRDRVTDRATRGNHPQDENQGFGCISMALLWNCVLAWVRTELSSQKVILRYFSEQNESSHCHFIVVEEQSLAFAAWV